MILDAIVTSMSTNIHQKIYSVQKKDTTLLALQAKFPQRFVSHNFYNTLILVDTTKGYRIYVPKSVISDIFFKWSIVWIHPTYTSTIINYLIDRWIAIFGLPHTITTDQGSIFVALAFQDFLEEYQIKRIYTTAYHPQSYGLVVRFNRRLKEAITARNVINWNEVVPWILLGFRHSKGVDIDYTPFTMSLYYFFIIIHLHYICEPFK